MNFIVHDVEQRSEEWRALRIGRLTASRAADMTATIKSGEAAARRNLRVQLVLERLTGRSHEKSFVSRAMEVGIEREDDALSVYEAVSGRIVRRSGFLTHPTLMAGCSLDGYLGDYDRLVSVKCRQPAAHLDFLRTGRIPTDALMQMIHELWITGAQEHEYFSWNPDFPEPLQAKSVVIHREACGVGSYAESAIAFLKEVDAEVEAVRTMTNLAGVLTEAVSHA